MYFGAETEISECGGLKRQMTPKLSLTIPLGFFSIKGLNINLTHSMTGFVAQLSTIPARLRAGPSD